MTISAIPNYYYNNLYFLFRLNNNIAIGYTAVAVVSEDSERDR